MTQVSENKYEATKYKSAYHYGEHLMQLFVNFKDGCFSFLIKKDKYYFVYNLLPEEKLKIVKAMILQLSEDERISLMENLD